MSETKTESFSEYRKLIMSELKRLNTNVENLEDTSKENLVEISKLRVWSAIYGAAGGTLAVLFLKMVVDKW